MYFRQIIGQEEAKRRLIREANEGRIAHARLFGGSEGVGKLPLAIAYARYLLCQHPTDEDACGQCPNCIKIDKLAHPDLHFVFPVVKKKGGKDTVSDEYLTQWRNLLLQTPYFNLPIWLQEMEAENQQAQIFVKEASEILRKLSLKSSQGGRKVMIIWLPEKMNTECANKLLKLLEEPPEETVFLLVSEAPDLLLPTILSRTQRFELKAIDEDKVKEHLIAHYGLQPTDAADIARRSEGNWLKALEAIHLSEENKRFFELFVYLMRLAYQRKLKDLRQWSETVAALGRERQKHFLIYCQRMVRENFMTNFHNLDLVRLNTEEQQFAVRFAPFINERNIFGIMDELSEAQRHIEQNVNARMVFFDFTLKIIMLLKN